MSRLIERPPSDAHPKRPAARGLRVTAIAGALLAVLAACAPSGGIPADDPRSEVVVDLSQYEDQKLDWGTCDEFVRSTQDEEVFPLVPEKECARLEVPLDYADPNGDTASIAVIRIPARGEPLGSLFFNPGGPGGAGILGTIGAALFTPESAVTESFDLIGFDPRGVGATEPAVDCGLTDGSEEGADLLAKVGTPFLPLTKDDTREIVDRCADGSGGVEALKHVGTRTTAKDMDLLREVLGEDQLNFLGQSYGSRLGTVYAEEFPENVRAMILDGAFDPNLGSQDRLLESYVGFQSQFEKMAVFCATQAGCPLGADPNGWTPALQALLQPLAENPIPAGDAELDFASGVGGVMGGLFSPDAWPLVIEGLREVQQGRGDTLLSLSTAIGGITDEGESSNQVDASLVINCVDETLLGADELAVLREDTYDRAPMLDPGAVDDAELRDKCADFPLTGELEIPYGQHVDGLPPLLVVSLTDDPTTPLSGAVGLADTLGGTLLTVDGAGHTVIAKGVSSCADAIAAAYLIDLELPEEGTTCAAD